MRWYGILAALFLCAAVNARAAFQTFEIPNSRAGTSTTVSVSTSAWTLIPSASTLSPRSAVCVSNVTSNSASMFFSLSASAPTASTTTWAWELAKGQSTCFPVDNNLKVYGVSGNTAEESVRAQEWGQY